MKEVEEITSDDWEVCLLVCPKGHEKKLSILKQSEVRNTFCVKCGKAVLFKRKPAGMVKISSAKFTWENYGLNQGENGWRLLNIEATSIPCEGYSVVGYCDGSGLSVKPGNTAVMFLREDDSVEFWLHVAEHELEKLNASLANKARV
jgi:hypothetical protein